MSDYHTWDSIQSTTPTICTLLSLPYPALTSARPIEEVVLHSSQTFTDGPPQKVLIFAPDAIGNHLSPGYGTVLRQVADIAPIEIHLKSVVPSVTPVCFASMFTGGSPSQHGIRKYERPVVGAQTLFDALLAAGKRVAIVAVTGSSIDLIFRGRSMDYYSEKYDPDVTQRVLSLLERDQHDFILAYQQEYDDVMHRFGPFAPEAIRALNNHVDSFVRIAGAFDRYWRQYDRVIAFCPDHGAHTDSTTGRGSHGEDIAADMELRHFYGLGKASSLP